VVRVLRFFAFALVTLAFAGVASPAMPVAAQESVVDCGDEVATVRTAIETAVAGGAFANSKDGTALLGKVASAEGKLAEGKPADAAADLDDIRVKVTALLAAPKPKVDADAGQAILEATDAAIACLTPPAPVV
jgi:hypothetical protein